MKIYCLILTMLFLSTNINAETSKNDEQRKNTWQTHYVPGNLLIDLHAGGNPENHSLLHLNSTFMLRKFYISNQIPLDLGLNLTGMFSTQEESRLAAGAGAGLAAHIGFRGMGGRFANILERLDIFLELGAGYTWPLKESRVEDWTGFENMPLTAYSRSGVSWFFNDHLALTVANSSWGKLSGLGFGLRFKAGKSPESSAANTRDPQPATTSRAAIAPASSATRPAIISQENLSRAEARSYIDLFRNLYWPLFAHGGILIDDYNYIDAEGVSYKIAILDTRLNDFRTTRIGKALLKRDLDYSLWAFDLNSGTPDAIRYEIRLDHQGLVEEMHVIEGDTAYSYVPEFPMEWNTSIVLAPEDFTSFQQDRVRKETPAGPILCDILAYDAGQFAYRWWISRDVPGYLAAFEVRDNNRTIITGEMEAITLGNRSLLPSGR